MFESVNGFKSYLDSVLLLSEVGEHCEFSAWKTARTKWQKQAAKQKRKTQYEMKKANAALSEERKQTNSLRRVQREERVRRVEANGRLDLERWGILDQVFTKRNCYLGKSLEEVIQCENESYGCIRGGFKLSWPSDIGYAYVRWLKLNALLTSFGSGISLHTLHAVGHIRHHLSTLVNKTQDQLLSNATCCPCFIHLAQWLHSVHPSS